MNSFATRCTLPLLRSLLLLATTALPCAGHAQTAAASSTTATPDQYLQLIDSIEVQQGTNAAELIEPLTALSTLYLEQAAYAEAAAGFERARGVVRINQGLGTVQELELLHQQVRVEQQAGHVAEAWELEKSLMGLAREHAGHAATIAIYTELANERLDILRRYRAGEFPLQVELGCYYGSAQTFAEAAVGDTTYLMPVSSSKGCRSGNRKNVLVSLQREIRVFQLAAMLALLQNNRYTGPELQTLVAGLLRASDSLHRLNRTYNDPFLYRAMQSVLGFEPSDAATATQQAHFLVWLADMNVDHAASGTRPPGFDAIWAQYRQAYAQLEAAGATPEELNAVFAPSIPVMLPSYNANPLAEAAATPTAAYADVELDIDHYGRPAHVKLVEATGAVPRAARSELLRSIKSNRFRPYLRDGQFAESTHVTVRYYFPAEPPAAD